MESHAQKKLTHNPCLHHLEKGQVYPFDEHEFLVKQLDKLPHDFMDMTLFDLDGKGGLYVFSRIVTYYEGKKKCSGAVYRDLLVK